MIALSVVIVNWNSQTYLDECLRSLAASIPQTDYEVIIVDNASVPPPDPAQFRSWPNIRWLLSDENIGFGQANNRGVAVATGRYILVMNPDMRDLVGGPAQRCMEFLDANPGYGCAGVRILKPDHTLAPDCARRVPTVTNSILYLSLLDRILVKLGYRGSLDMLEWDHCTDADVPVICGCFMLFPRHVFLELGGFSPDIFLFGEDADLCMRLGQAGHRIRYLAGPVVTHIGAGSTRQCSQREMTARQFAGVQGVLRNLYGPGAVSTFLLGCCLLLPALAVGALAAGAIERVFLRGTRGWRLALRFAWGHLWACRQLIDAARVPVPP